MPVDPTTLIAEVLGRPAQMGFDPAAEGYICPFTKTRCVKAASKAPLPVCSVFRGAKHVIICPKRLLERDVIEDVVDNCWTAMPPIHKVIAPEVQLGDFGNVDFVVADLDGAHVTNFVSVEAQAVDVTGSYRPAYDALVLGETLSRAPTFNLNWDNVYKRYITQLIRKGFYHHHWDTKMVALMQDEVYNYIYNKFPFLTTTAISDPSVNIVFLLYRIVDNGPYRLVVDRAVGTSHANLSQAALYAKAPDRSVFEEKILRALARSINST
ncbi:hypothetical protein [Sandarakinorhabdus sp.]|uniref:hypothetical protein n=1 Tax=Sandarakinorhabdus sp. TaxID=1916663 RepID=UPI003F708097